MVALHPLGSLPVLHLPSVSSAASPLWALTHRGSVSPSCAHSLAPCCMLSQLVFLLSRTEVCLNGPWSPAPSLTSRGLSHYISNCRENLDPHSSPLVLKPPIQTVGSVSPPEPLRPCASLCTSSASSLFTLEAPQADASIAEGFPGHCAYGISLSSWSARTG